MKDSKAQKGRGAQWRHVVLPAEHGSWGLVLEPIALGLLAAFSWAGVLLGLGAFLGFLAFQPLRVAWRGIRRGARGQRQRLARQWGAAFGFSALVLALWGLSNAAWQPLGVLLLAAPLGLIYLRYDLEQPSRAWQAEVSGTLAFGSLAAAIAIVGGWPLPQALALWALMAARGLPSVMYVRARLRLEKGREVKGGLALGLHALALAGVWLLARSGLLSGWTIAALLILLLRALLGLSPWRWERSTRVIGFMEIAYGTLLVLMAGLGS